jgi:peptide/nickel transport system substrate-binding protein
MSEIENDLIDELTSGRIDRREFLRHGSVLGLGMPLLSTLAGALGFTGLGAAAFAPAARAAKPGGTIRAATSLPAGAIDPVTVDDNGGPADAAADRRVPAGLRPRSPAEAGPGRELEAQ